MNQPHIRPHPKFTNIYISGSAEKLKLYTKNLDKGKTIYGERLVIKNDEEFRPWDPFRSKFAALILKGAQEIYIERTTTCLYLGASTGTTISHVSDIISKGLIFGVDISERSLRQLIQNTSSRKNIIPILGNALNPQEYSILIYKPVDLIYQDVSHPEQANIAIRNATYYLKEGGKIILFIKSQSIDSTVDPEKVYKKEMVSLKNANFKIREKININSYAANHIGLIIEK